ncbi:UNVERIFIED_CONTAM: hypothetical protein K2H54_059272 [Gekko kuhli]
MQGAEVGPPQWWPQHLLRQRKRRCRDSRQRSTFIWLVENLRDRLQRERTVMREPVPVEKRVTIGFWWMVNTMSYRAIGQQFGLARSTVAGIVRELTHAIADKLLRRVVYLRNPDRALGKAQSMSSTVHAFPPSGAHAKGGAQHRFACAVIEEPILAMAFPTKGVLWLPEKVEYLLRILYRLEAGPRIMPSTHLDTMGVFGEASEIMQARGYRRTAIHCRAKFKREKAALFDALEDWDGMSPPGSAPPASPSSGHVGTGQPPVMVPSHTNKLVPSPWHPGHRLLEWDLISHPPPGRPRARWIQQAPPQEEDTPGSPTEPAEEPQGAEPIVVASGPEPTAAEDSPSNGGSPQAVAQGAAGGTPILVSSAMQTATEEEPQLDPDEGPSMPPATQRLYARERGMAQLRVTEGGTAEASMEGEASTEEEAEGPHQAIPLDPEGSMGWVVAEPDVDSE